ncbi:glycosyltransferase [Leucothrix sargassi]|nr:glycosyltransferase [Leucothrix sargassi]
MKKYNYIKLESIQGNSTAPAVKVKNGNPNAKIFEKSDVDDGFDPLFYRNHYKDLRNLSDKQLRKHWLNFGKKEGRICNIASLFQKMAPNAKLSSYMDSAWFYGGMNDDLYGAGFSDVQLVLHYLNNGLKEGRFFLPENWLDGRGIHDASVRDQAIAALRKLSRPGKALMLSARSLVGLDGVPCAFYSDDNDNKQLYQSVAVELLKNGRVREARNAFYNAIYFGGSSKTFELMGNMSLDEGDYGRAESYFKASVVGGSAGHWAYKNLGDIYLQTSRFEEAVDTLLSGLSENPDSEQVRATLLAAIDAYWNETSAKLDAVKSGVATREELLELANERTQKLYQAWFGYYTLGKVEDAAIVEVNNSSKILIVGDFHITQCIRYRINQKVEQLEHEGFDVDTVSWTEIDSAKVHLPFYDIVIFYRVPAVNQVVRQIAQTKALGKVAIYEIDDQIFLPNYPAPLETFGRAVDFTLYQDLIKGMALSNAAIRLCDYSIASTNSLDRDLKALVKTGKGYVHRNGLDKINTIDSKPLSTDPAAEITLFYGSGTLAHNSDFIDLALPGIKKILTEFSNVRLVVMGHLELPSSFQKKYKKQYRQLPKLNDVKAYLAYLSRADINLAVLHDDAINGAKSELKWFEAACYQIPSVVSSTENYRDVVTDGHDCYIAESEEDWYTSIRNLVKDAELRAKIGRNAQEKVLKDYSVESLGKGLASFINSISASSSTKKKPKICLVNVFFPPQSIGGATRVVADNFDVLVDKYKDDFEVCVFTSQAHYKEAHEVTTYSYKGVRVYQATVTFRENMDWHPKDSRMYEVFREFLELEKPDKVHFHCVQRLTASVVEATKDAGIPYLVTAHDAWWISDHQFLVDQEGKVYPEGHPDPYEHGLLPNNVSIEESLAREGYLKSLINSAETVLTVSNAFAEIYRVNGVPKISVTKNGVSAFIDWRKKSTKYTDNVVCAHIGGMSEHKGYDLLKASVLSIQPQNIELLIVDHSKPVDFNSVEFWGEVKVSFIGRQNQETIPQLYEKVDVLFSPSIWPESFGLVTREAAVCGCWVVASSLGGIGEDVIENENGHIIEPNSRAMDKVLTKIDRNTKKYKNEPVSKNLPRDVSLQVAELIEYYR